jgi:sortase A
MMDDTVVLRFQVPDLVEHRTGPERGAIIRHAVRTVGELMITFGLILLLFSGYEIWGKSIIVDDHQRDMDAQLAQDWAQPGGSSVDSSTVTGPGKAPAKPAAPTVVGIARMFIPRMNKHWVVAEGVAPADIRYAPGHYPGTAMPGQIGNFSVAGHRIPSIFWDLDQLKPGDAVVVQTKTTYYIYKVTVTEVVKPTAVEVVAPVPDHPGLSPTDAMLTLTTCNPKWDNYQRLIVHAQLARSQPVSKGAPAEIQGM